ncbi:hypothetical protein [Streptomyces sp. S.PNR 29]|uniref:hypothetical protein n=1 Tax=Streptomyces sp. S.PNR 29 TaxID=2973805 RepID=UPI0025B00D58|nr:hypothetical protein [Streptomyces sp. S.PNR 29]MDN0193470.1 hypothetical protein [Streptomyces sp. S.PNR 29]
METPEGHLLWAARIRPDGRPGSGVRTVRQGGAIAAASPALSGRDRSAVAGEEGDAVALVREVPREVGPAYRPFGAAGLIDALVRRIPGPAPGGPPFLWMETQTSPGPVPPGVG